MSTKKRVVSAVLAAAVGVSLLCGFGFAKKDYVYQQFETAEPVTSVTVGDASAKVTIQAADTLESMSIHARIINMSTIKPLDEELVLKAAKECGKIITCEEHNILGGLGEAVCGVLSEKLPTPVRRIGVNDEFGHSGPAGALLKQFGLSAEHIVEVAKSF